MMSLLTATKKHLFLSCGVSKSAALITLYTVSYPSLSNSLIILFLYSVASPIVIPATFSPITTLGIISAVIRVNSKNKSSIFSTFLPSEYIFSWSQPFSLLPAILNAEQGGAPSNISNSPFLIPAIFKKSSPVSFFISSGKTGVFG